MDHFILVNKNKSKIFHFYPRQGFNSQKIFILKYHNIDDIKKKKKNNRKINVVKKMISIINMFIYY